MKYLQKYWPLFAILAAFFCGQFSGGKPDKEVKEKYEQERERDQEAIIQNNKIITRLQADSAAIQELRVSDSLYFAGALEVKERAYNKLKREYAKINLGGSTAAQLDSIRAVLYAKPLHPDR